MRLMPVAAFEDNYIWLLADASGDALAVDPGDAAPLEAALQREGLRLCAVLLTHHHADHIGGVDALAARHHPVILAPPDARIPLATRRVTDGEHIELAAPATPVEVLAVPGHTASHVAYRVGDLLFCGDTLFSLGCGRLFEGTPETMLSSLDRIAGLPAATRLCPAHEYTESNAAFASSIDADNPALIARARAVRMLRARQHPSLPVTLGEERASNPFLRVDSPAVRAWCARHGVADDRIARFAALRRAKDGFRA
jgi:hydroxyacylglutathione hydrolase